MLFISIQFQQFFFLLLLLLFIYILIQIISSSSHNSKCGFWEVKFEKKKISEVILFFFFFFYDKLNGRKMKHFSLFLKISCIESDSRFPFISVYKYFFFFHYLPLSATKILLVFFFYSWPGFVTARRYSNEAKSIYKCVLYSISTIRMVI